MKKYLVILEDNTNAILCQFHYDLVKARVIETADAEPETFCDMCGE